MKERNYGIDMLKILSMFMVVVLHIQGNGGMLSNSIQLSLNDSVMWFIEILCYPAVNLFALTTGYLCINKKFKLKNIINLWFLVVFYNLIFNFLCRGVGIIQLLDSIFPVLNYDYWYFSAYFCLMLFIPFINKYLNNISESDYRKLVFLIVFAACGLEFLANIMGSDIFVINDGYSAIWLLCLYIIGGYIKLYDFKSKNFSKKKCFILYLLFSFIPLLLRIIILKNPFLQIFVGSNFMIKYNSIFIYLSSLFLFLLFIKIKVKDDYKKILSFLAGLSFSVYIIHFNPELKLVYLNGRLSFFTQKPVFEMVYMILFSAFIIYILCTVIDVIRYYLFKILKVEKLSEKMDKKIVCLLTKKG